MMWLILACETETFLVMATKPSSKITSKMGVRPRFGYAGNKPDHEEYRYEDENPNFFYEYRNLGYQEGLAALGQRLKMIALAKEDEIPAMRKVQGERRRMDNHLKSNSTEVSLGPHRHLVVKTMSKSPVKRFLQEVNRYGKERKLFSNFPVQGSPNVMIEDPSYHNMDYGQLDLNVEASGRSFSHNAKDESEIDDSTSIINATSIPHTAATTPGLGINSLSSNRIPSSIGSEEHNLRSPKHQGKNEDVQNRLDDMTETAAGPRDDGTVVKQNLEDSLVSSVQFIVSEALKTQEAIKLTVNDVKEATDVINVALCTFFLSRGFSDLGACPKNELNFPENSSGDDELGSMSHEIILGTKMRAESQKNPSVDSRSDDWAPQSTRKPAILLQYPHSTIKKIEVRYPRRPEFFKRNSFGSRFNLIRGRNAFKRFPTRSKYHAKALHQQPLRIQGQSMRLQMPPYPVNLPLSHHSTKSRSNRQSSAATRFRY